MTDLERRPDGNWGADPRRAPPLAEGDTLLRDECGRIINRIDYRSHYLRLVKAQFGGYYILVKHGGGTERVSIGYGSRVPAIIAGLGSEDAYLLMYEMRDINAEAERRVSASTAATYRRAFAEGLLKKRKVRGSAAVKVWIDSPKIGECNGKVQI